MTQTKTKKICAALALGAIALSNFSTVGATQIGTGSVATDPAFDAAITWDNNFPGTASGSVTDILIKATVMPSLNMQISATEIDLGVLLPNVAATGNLDLEIGTNAVNGVIVTARSQNAGLTNVADPTLQINDLTTDGLAESYTWASTVNATNDSSFTAFSATGLTELEVNDNTTEHVVYDTTKPEATTNVDDVNFAVSTTVTAETPAGEYEDYVTFTVTGSF